MKATTRQTAKFELITPKRAEYYLSLVNPERQRRVSAATVESYAAAMRAGQWLIADQGISISQSGELINGQHRMRAIIMSGVAVEMLVVTGLPDESIDVTDRGGARTVAQQLKLRHGFQHASQIVPIARMIGVFVGLPHTRRHSVHQAMTVISHYSSEIEYIIGTPGPDKTYAKTPIMAAAAFAMHAKDCGSEIAEFYRQYITGEGLTQSMPSFILRRQVNNVPRSGGGSLQLQLARAAFSAMRAHVNGSDSKHYKTQYDAAWQFFQSKQKAECRRVLQALGEEPFLS